jgi:hypothetical protein
MKKIIISSMFLIFVISSFGNAFSQEGFQYFANNFKSGNNCFISHVYSNKLYVPASVKIYHDETPNFGVQTNSTTVGAQINPLGSDPTVYILNVPNSTAQFSIQVFAKYSDGKEHPFLIEYWSQNAPLSADQYSTINSQFCHTIMIDTALAPVIPNVQDTARQITQSLFGQFVQIVSQNTTTNYYAIVIEIIFSAIIVIAISLLVIRMGGYQDMHGALSEKMVSLIKNQNKNIVIFNNDRKLQSIEMSRMIKSVKALESGKAELLRSFLDEFEIRFRTLFMESTRSLELRDLAQNQEPIVETLQPEQPVSPQVEPPKEEEPKSSEQKSESLLKKTVGKAADAVKTIIFDQNKPEKPITSYEEFYQLYSQEKDTDKLSERLEKVLQIYSKNEEEEKRDDSIINESHAIHKIIMERNNIES